MYDGACMQFVKWHVLTRNIIQLIWNEGDLQIFMKGNY